MDTGPQPIDPPVAPGAAAYKQLLDNGAAQQDAEAWKQNLSKQARDAGFKQGEIDKYWGDDVKLPSPELVQHVSQPGQMARIGSADVELPSADMRGHMIDHYQAGKATDQGSWYEQLGKALGHVDVGEIGQAGKEAMREQFGINDEGKFTPETYPPFETFAQSPFGEKLLGTPEGRTWYQSIARSLGGMAIDYPALTYRAVGAYIAGGVAELGMFLKQTGVTDENRASVMEAARNAPQAIMDTMAAVGPAFEMPSPKAPARAITVDKIRDFYANKLPDASSFAAAARAVKANATPVQLKEIEAAHVEAYKETGIAPHDLADHAASDRGVRDEVMLRDPQGQMVTPNIKKVSPPEPSAQDPQARMLSLAEDREAAERGDKASGDPSRSFSEIARGEVGFGQVLNVFQKLEGSGETAISPKGAVGKYQIMPGTAQQYGFKPEDRFDPVKNEQMARAILTDLAHRFDGDIEAMAVAYNAGPGVARTWVRGGRDINSLPLETQHYVEHLRRMNGQPALLDYARPSRGVNWQRFDTTSPEMSRVNARDPRTGVVRPDPYAVGSYLKNFGEEANFGFTIGDEAKRQFGSMASADAAGHMPHWNSNTRRVYIPNEPEELYQRWYGLSKYDVLYHEVGHALHRTFEPDAKTARQGWQPEEMKPSGTDEAPGPSLKDEMQATSKMFHPDGWAKYGDYKGTRIETMADNIAMWVSRPEMHEQMELFGEKYGDKLAQYVDMARRNLPSRGTGENTGRWRAPERDGGAWLTAGGDTGEAPGWGGSGGGKPPRGGLPVPPPGGGPLVPSPSGPRFIRNLDMAHEGFNDMVGKDPPGTFIGGINRFVRQWVSELDPARKIDSFLQKHIDGYKGTHIEDAFRNVYGSAARAGEYLLNGVADPLSSKVQRLSSNSVKGAMDLAKAAGGTYEGFRNYLLAARTVDKAKLGIDTGFNHEDALTILTGEKGKYAEAAKMWTGAMNDALEYGRRLGIFNKDQVARMIRDNPSYISMRRVVEGEGAFSSGKGFMTRDPLRTMEGSDRQVRDPILASLDNLRLIVEMADRNRAAGNIVGAVENPLGTPLGLKRLKYDPKETISAGPGDPFKPYSLNDTAPQETWQSLVAEKIRREEQDKAQSNVFTYIRDGKVEKWSSDMPGLADMMRGARNSMEGDFIVNAFRGMAKIDRAGIVLPSGFPIRVWLKHQVTAWVLDPTSPPPFITSMRGAMDAFQKGDAWSEWIHNGGGGAAMSELNTKYIARSLAETWDATGYYDRAMNVVRHPIEAARVIHELLDTSSRLGYNERALGKGMDPMRAAMASRKAYLDFSERAGGMVANLMAQTIPFFRPHVLGLLQLKQSLSTPDGAVKSMGKAMVGLTGPAVMLAIANRMQDPYLPESERYGNLPQEVRDTHIIFPSVNGTRVMLPVPYNIGYMFFGLPQRFVQSMWDKDSDAFNNWAAPIFDEWKPSLVPSLVVPPVEWATNYNLNSGRKLMPGNMGSVFDDAQGSSDLKYVPGTTSISKWLSTHLGTRQGLGFPMTPSPIAMDRLATEWAGALGQTALKILDTPFSTDTKPWEIADAPVIGALFARKPGLNATPIQEFFHGADQFSRAHEDLKRSQKRDQQGVPGAEADVDATSKVNAAQMKLDKINTRKASLYNMTNVIQGIRNDKSMGAAEKAQYEEDVFTQMIELAEDGKEILKGAQ